MRSRRAIACSARFSPPALAMINVPTSGWLVIDSMMRGNSSLLRKPVRSAGLAAQPKSLMIPLSSSVTDSLSGGRWSPAAPSMSAVSELTPPEWDTTAMPGGFGRGARASSCETSSSSS